MPARTLLLVTYHFPPSAAVAVHRMLGYVRHLPRFGWNVAVVAPPQMPGEPLDAALLDLVPRDTTVLRVPFPSGWMSNFARRLAGDAVWLPAALRQCTRAIHRLRPDAVLTSSPPECVHYLGMYLKSRFGIPWAASLRDPWHTGGIGSAGLNSTLNRLMESRMVSHADCVIANTPINLHDLQSAYPEHAAKMRVITNGFDAETLQRTLNGNGKANGQAGEPLNLLHAGELYSGRDPRPLLDALAAHKAASGPGPGWKLTFLGRATQGLCDLPAEIQKRRLGESVALRGQVPYAEALTEMAHADALLVMHQPGRKNGVPAKLYEYVGLGRPILALAEPDSDIAWVLKESGTPYRLAPATDVAAIQTALAELRRTRAVATHCAAQSPFTRENMACLLAEALDTICRPSHIVQAR